MKRKILIVLAVLIVIGIGGFFYVQSIISTKFNIAKNAYIYIDEAKNYNDVLLQLDTTTHVKSLDKFKQLASYMDYPTSIKSGRYEITPDMNILEVIRLLQRGKQAPVKLRFNNIRLKSDLAKRISEQLMMSEEQLLKALNDSVICSGLGFSTETVDCMFIPNTYEFYWDITTESFLKKMDAEYIKFWNDERKKKAETLNLTPIQVSILASIVEEECYFTDEYPMVAGLYLNRFQKGQLLQADPTVKFAVGDFSLKRILFKHLEVNSPYNTYKNTGLPPGPIRIPSIKGIDAVLNASKHEFLYMCAKEDFSGRHNFAKTHAEHEKNANRYRNALNRNNIR